MANLAIIGIGGYGQTHLNAAREMERVGLARLVAVADTRLQTFPAAVADLRARGVACYSAHRELLARHPDLDLVTLPLPIWLHAPVTMEYLERGVHVLVEKPPAATVAQAQAMLAASRRTGRLCGVAFQHSTSPMVRAACRAIAAGRLGEIADVSVLCLAQRPDSYYARAPWAGRITFNGEPVRDGSLNNPFAHFGQMALALAGAARGRPAHPTAVEAELYAAHDIETEDTACVRATLDTGATLHFASSLCSREPWAQEIRVTGSAGVMRWSSRASPQGRVESADGAGEVLPDLVGDGGATRDVLRDFLEVLGGRAQRLASPLEDTIGFVELVEMVFSGARVTHLRGTPFVERKSTDQPGEVRTYLAEIEAVAWQAFERGALYSEVGAPWAGG